jgi:hypothetical protein
MYGVHILQYKLYSSPWVEEQICHILSFLERHNYIELTRRGQLKG